MEKLSEKMQERLEKWRKNTIAVTTVEHIKGSTYHRGRSTYGDVLTIEEWEEETKRSQNYRR